MARKAYALSDLIDCPAGSDGASEAIPNPPKRFPWKSLCRRLRFRFVASNGNIIEVDVLLVTPAESRRWTGSEWNRLRLGPLMLMVSLTS